MGCGQGDSAPEHAAEIAEVFCHKAYKIQPTMHAPQTWVYEIETNARLNKIQTPKPNRTKKPPHKISNQPCKGAPLQIQD